jgi:hypothetical protein
VYSYLSTVPVCCCLAALLFTATAATDLVPAAAPSRRLHRCTAADLPMHGLRCCCAGLPLPLPTAESAEDAVKRTIFISQCKAQAEYEYPKECHLVFLPTFRQVPLRCDPVRVASPLLAVVCVTIHAGSIGSPQSCGVLPGPRCCACTAGPGRFQVQLPVFVSGAGPCVPAQ